MKNIIQLIGIILLMGCNTSNDSESMDTKSIQISDQSPKKEEQIKETEEIVFFDISNSEFKTEFKESTKHYFSNLETEDHFEIYVPIGNINKTISSITIKNNNGDTIFQDSFNTHEWIYSYALDGIKSDEELITHIKERISKTLVEESFINFDTPEEPNFASLPEDPEVYESCRDKKLPLFMYTTGAESSVIIGYSIKIKKAIDLFYCC
jgi:hypothetical protein